MATSLTSWLQISDGTSGVTSFFEIQDAVPASRTSWVQIDNTPPPNYGWTSYFQLDDDVTTPVAVVITTDDSIFSGSATNQVAVTSRTSWVQIDNTPPPNYGWTSYFQIEGISELPVPSNVEVTILGGTSILISITDNSSGLAQHRWQVAPVSTGVWVNAIGATNPSNAGVTTFSVIGLTPATEYLARVRAEQGGLLGAYVETVTPFWTDNSGSGDPVVPVLPVPMATAIGLRNLNQSFSGKRICSSSEIGTDASLLNPAGYLFPQVSLPADNGKLIQGFITTYPSAGTLTAQEDGTFSHTGAPVGSYSLIYDLRVDEVLVGSRTFNFSNGVTASITSTTDPSIFAGSISNNPGSVSAAINVTTDPSVFAGFVGSVSAAINVTTDPSEFLGSASNGIGGVGASLNITADSSVFAGLVTNPASSISAIINVTTGNSIFTGSITNLVSPIVSFNIVTDNSAPAIYVVNTSTPVTIAVTTSPSVPNISASIVSTSVGFSVTTDNSAPFITVLSEAQSPQLSMGITTENSYVNISAYGLLPPVINGPITRLPIPLSMSQEGKLIISL
jgi:hypothetical protein